MKNAYICTPCGKGFCNDFHLHSHRIDSDCCKKCIYCDVQITSSKQIKKHMKSKHKDIPCRICKRKFYLTGALNQHTRDVHDGKTSLPNPTHNTKFLTGLKECGNSLKRLLHDKVKQDPGKTRRCNKTVDYIAKFLHKHCGVREVVKGGSLGKGTSIRKKVDIDLVVFMKRFTSVSDLQEQHEEVIKDLKKHILKDFPFATKLHYSYDTKHSNRFGIETDGGRDLIEVDLLPACDIGGGTETTFQKMAGLSEEERAYYSVSFVKDQIKFTKDKPDWVKDAICLSKHWKTSERLNIPSYSVEILTIKEWERMGRPEQADLTQLFKRTMTQLSDMRNVNVTWPNSRPMEGSPVVMDPANPFNNTASRIRASDLRNIERKAGEVVDWL